MTADRDRASHGMPSLNARDAGGPPAAHDPAAELRAALESDA